LVPFLFVVQIFFKKFYTPFNIYLQCLIKGLLDIQILIGYEKYIMSTCKQTFKIGFPCIVFCKYQKNLQCLWKIKNFFYCVGVEDLRHHQYDAGGGRSRGGPGSGGGEHLAPTTGPRQGIHFLGHGAEVWLSPGEWQPGWQVTVFRTDTVTLDPCFFYFPADRGTGVSALFRSRNSSQCVSIFYTNNQARYLEAGRHGICG